MCRSRITLSIAALSALLCGPVAAAQGFQPMPVERPTPPRPDAPRLVSPAAGTVVLSEFEGTHIRVQWQEARHVGVRTPPPRAQWFAICVFDPNAMQFCHWPPSFGSPFVLETAAANSILSDPVYVNDPNGPRRYYRNVSGPPLTGTQRLAWRVAACTQPSEAYCAWSDARPVIVTPHNLTIDRLRLSQAGAGTLAFSATVGHWGSAPSPSRTTEIHVWRVITFQPCSPVKDYRLPGVPGDARIILRDGTVVDRSTNPPLEQVLGIENPRAAARTSDRRTATNHVPWGGQQVEAEAYLPAPGIPTSYIVWTQTQIEGTEVDGDLSNNWLYQHQCWQ